MWAHMQAGGQHTPYRLRQYHTHGLLCPTSKHGLPWLPDMRLVLVLVLDAHDGSPDHEGSATTQQQGRDKKESADSSTAVTVVKSPSPCQKVTEQPSDPAAQSDTHQ